MLPLDPRFGAKQNIEILLASFTDGSRWRERHLFYQPEFEAILERYLDARAEKSNLEKFVQERKQVIRDTLKVFAVFLQMVQLLILLVCQLSTQMGEQLPLRSKGRDAGES